MNKPRTLAISFGSIVLAGTLAFGAVASAAGDTEAVERIDRRLDRMDRVSTKIDDRLTKFETWTSEHCTA